MKLQERMDVILRLMKENYLDLDDFPFGSCDPFRILIGCILSHRTRDENASRAASNLFETVENPKDIFEMDQDILKGKIRCSGFYNQKANRIQAICKILVDEFDGEVPKERSDLIGLPGVGYKTADIVLSNAFGKPAIAVDVHISRVSRRLGFAQNKADPEQIKKIIESLVPSSEYRFVDNVFVMHGKEYCRKSNPRCSECFLNELCSDYLSNRQ